VKPQVDVLVIGAGVVGLACARELALRGRHVLLVERHGSFGRETSSRNSGVIHAGLHYAPGSWMGRSCVEGRARLYRYCTARGVAHERTGKLVLAVDSTELSELSAMAERGMAMGAGRLELWDARELAAREPQMRAAGALFSPESGVVDAHGLMMSLSADLHAAGGDVAYGTRVLELHAESGGVRVRAQTGSASTEVVASQVLNAAGHGASVLLEALGVDLAAHQARVRPVAGRYMRLSAHAPRPEMALVYPLPSAGGLGIHLTCDLSGTVRAGPDALDASADLDVPEALVPRFAQAVARYLPGLRAAHLTPDFAGLRPRLEGPAETRDFRLINGADLSAAGTWHLLGIESPGLTASLALANDVARRLCDE